MKLALVSDIHDSVDTLAVALRALGPGGAAPADGVLCLGDLCSPFVMAQLAAGFAGPIHVVFGNNDADTFRMTRIAAEHAHVHLHGEFARLELGGRTVALTHFPDVADALDTRRFDLVAYGHDHLRAERERDGALVVNPGCLMGYDPGAAERVPATFGVWDTSRHSVASFVVRDGDVTPASDAA